MDLLSKGSNKLPLLPNTIQHRTLSNEFYSLKKEIVAPQRLCLSAKKPKKDIIKKTKPGHNI